MDFHLRRATVHAMKVHEIMTAHARSIGPENTLLEAAGLMRELDVGALPVCDQDELVGIVTDRDIVVRGIADARDPDTTPVSDVMSGATLSVSADQEVEEAVRLMEQHQVRRLPVLDNAKQLVGLVSLGDIATSSNPAFSGIALHDVSEPNEPTARRRRLERNAEPDQMPTVPGARRRPSGGGRRAAAANVRMSPAHRSDSGGKRSRMSSSRSGTTAGTRSSSRRTTKVSAKKPRR